MISPSDIITVSIPLQNANSEPLRQISANTSNTWQPARSQQEIQADTQIGKIAEAALQKYLTEQGVAYLSWDEIRTDNYRNHAPVDGFFMHPHTRANLELSTFIRDATAAQNPIYFTPAFRDRWEKVGVYGCEVKSTRVTDRLRHNGQVSYKAILGDDFLQYPSSTRMGTITSELRRILKQPAELQQSVAKSPQIFVRIYVEQRNSVCHAYIVGAISRGRFFESNQITIKPMRQPGKSDLAIYYAVPLCEGEPITTVVNWILHP